MILNNYLSPGLKVTAKGTIGEKITGQSPYPTIPYLSSSMLIGSCLPTVPGANNPSATLKEEEREKYSRRCIINLFPRWSQKLVSIVLTGSILK